MSKRPPPRVFDPAARELAALVAREVQARCGANATFEQRRAIAMAVFGDRHAPVSVIAMGEIRSRQED